MRRHLWSQKRYCWYNKPYIAQGGKKSLKLKGSWCVLAGIVCLLHCVLSWQELFYAWDLVESPTQCLCVFIHTLQLLACSCSTPTWAKAYDTVGTMNQVYACLTQLELTRHTFAKQTQRSPWAGHRSSALRTGCYWPACNPNFATSPAQQEPHFSNFHAACICIWCISSLSCQDVSSDQDMLNRPSAVFAWYSLHSFWTIEAHIVNLANKCYAVQKVTIVDKQQRQACMMFWCGCNSSPRLHMQGSQYNLQQSPLGLWHWTLGLAS